ncbi:MAG: hypothetical protein QGH11_09610 [Pirellulaceae bacterium]|nr:hypothetical protein [Pirellulaceae bacterium]
MRPFLAIVVIAVALGSVKAYTSFVGSATGGNHQQFQETAAEGRFHLELTLSFDARGDAFNPESVLLKLHGDRILLQIEEPVSAGTVLDVDPVEGIVVGKNEFYLKVATGEDDTDAAGFSLSTEDVASESTEAGGADKSRAVRIRVFQDDQPIAEKTIWSEPGQAVEGLVVIEVSSADGPTGEHVHPEGE